VVVEGNLVLVEPGLFGAGVALFFVEEFSSASSSSLLYSSSMVGLLLENEGALNDRITCFLVAWQICDFDENYVCVSLRSQAEARIT